MVKQYMKEDMRRYTLKVLEKKDKIFAEDLVEKYGMCEEMADAIFKILERDGVLNRGAKLVRGGWKYYWIKA